MRSATDFLPSIITMLMKRVSSSLPNFGSGRMSRLKLEGLRDINFSVMNSVQTRASALGLLGAVFGTALTPIADACGIQAAPHRVVANAGKILDTTTANQDDRVLLEVVPLATDVAGHLKAIRQTHSRDLAQRRVRLLRRRGVHARADTTFLRRSLERGYVRLVLFRAPRLADQLIDRRHFSKPLENKRQTDEFRSAEEREC